MHILLLQFFLLSVLALVLYLLQIKKRYKEMIFMVISFISMWYIHSRVNINTVPDLYNYESMFVNTKMMTWKACFGYVGGMEAGYVVLNKIVSTFTGNYYVFQGLYGFTLLFLYFSSFRRYSPYVIVSILLLLVGTFNISIYVLRQYLAVAIFVASFPLIIDRKMIPYLIICIFAFFIHKSAIICVPIYFMYQLRPKYLFLSMVLLTLGIFFLLDAFMIFSVETISDFEEYLGRNVTDSQSYIGAVIEGIILFIYVYTFRRIVWEEGIHKLIFILLILSVLVNIAIIGRPGTLSRLSSFYETATLYALPLILATKKDLLYKIACVACVFFLRVFPTFFGSIGLGDLTDMKLL